MAAQRAEERASVVEEWKLLEARLASAELVERADGPWLAVVTTKRRLGSAAERTLAKRWEPWLSLRVKRPVSVVLAR